MQHIILKFSSDLEMLEAATDDRIVIFLDIDNTLYSASSKISQAMGERIHGNIILYT